MRIAPNTLRIIGGQWRGRKLKFPEIDAIRPTPDRVRETLFNWLQHNIVGARCLDLFAGSGALGIEALSRGAVETVFVDREPAVAKYLRETMALLKAEGADVIVADANKWLSSNSSKPFDIVFLDPPFADSELRRTCGLLESQNWLASDAYIYIECSSTNGAPSLPANWSLIKSKTAGQVGYYLARRQNSAAKSPAQSP
jgi:16S rRNA (guanine966-N2)-methyltransferase